jgi:multiple sugar transport system substrate-binding protein
MDNGRVTDKKKAPLGRLVSRREFLKLGGTGLAGVTILGAAGCGGNDGSAKKELSWQAIPVYSLEAPVPARVKYVENAISEWEEANENFTIKPLVSSADITAAMAKLLEQSSEGRAPDIAQIDSYIAPRYYKYTQSLNPYLEDTEVTIDSWFQQFASLMTESGGQIKGLQFTTDIRVLYYRSDLISTPPTTWDEVITVGKQMKREGFDPFLFAGGRDEAAVSTSVWPHFWAQGGEIIDEDGNPVFAKGENREKMLNVLTFAQRCVQEGVTPQRVSQFGLDDDLNGDVASGETAMFLGGNWQVEALKDIMGDEEFVSKWEVAPIPSMSGDTHATTAGGWLWGVFTDDPDKQKAAVDFLVSSYVGDKGMAGWTTVGGYIPPRKPVFDVPAYQGNEYTAKFRDQLARYGRIRPAAQVYQEVSTAMQVALSEVISGTESPEDALTSAAREVQG